MKLFSSLDLADRRMLFAIVGLVVALLVLLAFVTPAEDADDSPIPDSYRATTHGAKAAFTLLQQSGYTIERWEQPLSELAAEADPSTILITAEPFSSDNDDRRSIATILRKGGRVLATGFTGGALLPRNHVTASREFSFAACDAQPDGLQPLASGGSIWIVPSATWEEKDPTARAAYTCAGQPVIVEYPYGSGHAVWWASSTPLENGSIARGANLDLLLNSVGPAAGRHIYWDESLHGLVHSPWDFVNGPVWPLLSFGAIGVLLLVIFSYSRRSGPLRALPDPPRVTPIEFLEALGGLYRATGATSTVIQIAWDRFRTQAALLTGQRNTQLNARELAAALENRFGSIAAGMEPDLVEAEESCWDDTVKPRDALKLIQALREHEETLRAATRHGITRNPSTPGVTLAS